MVNRRNQVVQRQLRTLFNLGTIGELTDGQLLERFATQSGEGSELAFAALVERHGAMVLGVCRNLLRDPHDVQDAFQATFLVLVEKAGSLWVRDSLGPWLHRVACRVSTRARASRAIRREHERRAAEMRPVASSSGSSEDDLAAVLHEEIDRLPARYRVPLVLCDLEGCTHERAARHLGWPIGTIKSRLGRARELLRGRLSRRGLGLPTGIAIAGVSSGSADALLLRPLVESAARSATAVVVGKASVVGVVSTRALMLTEEVLTTMFLTKLKLIAAVLLTASTVVIAAAGVLAQQDPGQRPAPTADQRREAVPAGTRRASGVEPASVPPHIRRSRKMMITRLEQEREAAKQRLDRSIRKAAAPDDSAVVQARKTLQDLDDLLIRIDRVLVDAVTSHPTIFDFSRAAAVTVSSAEANVEWSKAQSEWLVQPNALAVAKSTKEMPKEKEKAEEADLEVAKEQAEWAERMYKKGYVSRGTVELERSRYASAKESRLGNRELATSILLEAALTLAREQVDWRERMHKKGYATKQQIDSARSDYEALMSAVARAVDRIRWAESSFKMDYISKDDVESAYKDYERLAARYHTGRSAKSSPKP